MQHTQTFKNVYKSTLIATMYHSDNKTDLQISHNKHHTSSSSSDTELPLTIESYGLLNDIFPFPSILDADYPIFNTHLANALFDAVLPSVLGSSL